MDLIFAWSGGKDSALGLYDLLQTNEHRVVALLTTVTADYGRVSMHGVRRPLLQAQAEELNLPLVEVMIGKDADNKEYEDKMRAEMLRFQAQGVAGVAFADVFLQDLRQYRERNLAQVGMTALFPLWGEPTSGLARRFLALGFKAVVTCVDTHQLDMSFAGRSYDLDFLRDLPSSVDPAGENGEFHSFVHAGPLFPRPIPFTLGERVLRENRFAFCDLLPRE